MMTAKEFAEKAIDVPFKWRGRGWDGWDCWGLLYRYYKEVEDIEIPIYLDKYKGDDTPDYLEIAMMINEERALKWRKITHRRIGLAVNVYRAGRQMHVGITMPWRTILHCEEGVGTVITNENALRIEGFYEPVLKGVQK